MRGKLRLNQNILKDYLQENYFSTKSVFESADADPDVVAFIEGKLNEMLGYSPENQYSGKIWAVYVNNNGYGDSPKLFTIYATNVSRATETAVDYLKQTVRYLVGTVRFEGQSNALTDQNKKPWTAFYIRLTAAQKAEQPVLHVSPNDKNDKNHKVEPKQIIPTGPDDIYIEPPLTGSPSDTVR